VLSAGPNALERYGRYQESLRAVATCYRWTSREFARVEEATDEVVDSGCQSWRPQDEAVGGPGWRIVLCPRPVPDRLDADFRAGVNFGLTAFYEVRYP